VRTKEELLKIAKTTVSRLELRNLAKHADPEVAAAARANPRFPSWG
jgi:hypothetical protein